MKTSIALLATMSLVFVACSVSQGDETSESESSDALVGAPVDDRSRTFSVGVCQGALNADPAKGPVGTCLGGTGKCTGTLVAPNLVLTGRHCVRGAEADPAAAPGDPCGSRWIDEDLVPGGTRVTTSPSVMVGQPKWYDVAKILVPSGRRGCADDAALLVLSRNVPRSEAFPVDVDFRSPSSLPREVAIVGRGSVDFAYELDANGDWTGGVAKEDKGDLTRRVAQRIPVLCRPTDGPCTTISHELPAPRVFTLPEEWFLIGPGGAPGDSGSAVFDQRGFNLAGGRFARVTGLLVWGFIAPDGRTNNAGVVRLDLLASFLKDGAWQAARAGRYVLPGWARDDDSP